MSEWPYQSLCDLIEKDSLITYGVVKPGPEGSVRFVRGGDIANGNIAICELRTITEDVSMQYRRTLLRGGELLVSLVGNPGQVAIVPLELVGANIARQVGLVRLRKDINSQFIKYYLLSPLGRRVLGAQSIGSVQQVINLRDLKIVQVPVPDVNTQHAIAHILGSLDDKIELNNRINETLEAIAQTIFKSWFVNFDPVKAKAEGCELEGMDAETAPLFPDRLVESELGMIPEKWSISSVGEEFDITMGQSPPGSSYNENAEGVVFFQGRRDFGARYPRNRVYCTDPRRMANKGDTLLSVRAPVGDINKALMDCCIGRGLAAIRHKSGVEAYTYYSCQNLSSQLATYDTEGTVFGAINKKNLKQLKVIKPTKEVFIRFCEIVDKVDEMIENKWHESNSLESIRDSLLPKLVSGEIRLDQIKKIRGRKCQLQ